MTSRRTLLKGAAAVGGLTAFAAGYGHTVAKTAEGLATGSAGTAPRDPRTFNAPKPEFTVDAATGALTPNPDQQVAFTMCQACNTMCGVRVRTDKATDAVLRVAGNPYHPLSADRQIPYATPVRDAYLSLTRHGEAGLAGRSTACGRGNAALSQINNPYRVTTCLKRVGPRGAGEWRSIPYEQLIEEVCEGGDLFGEGPVAGLRALRDLETPLDPANPEYGPVANQVAILNATSDGRDEFIKRFAFNAYGTRNYGHHGSYCGLSMRVGSGAIMNDLNGYPHGKPDFENVEFAIFIGSAPGNAGKPFKRQGRLLAQARSEGKLNYVVVEPVLTNASSMAADDRNRWIPIVPGGDNALAMGMIRWILDNERYDARYLAQPGPKAAEQAGEASFSNATHLVVTQDGHPRKGFFLRGSDIGLPLAEVEGAERWKKGDVFLCIDAADGSLRPFGKPGPAQLFHTGTVETPEGPVAVKTSLQLLKDSAEAHSMADYAAACGLDVSVIEGLAREFTAHGKKAAVDCHGGTMHANGFYTAFSVLMLNLLIGNWNMKGGMVDSIGGFPDYAPGPRYDLAKFPGQVAPKGIFLSRSKFPYQKTSEFKRRKEAGESPYPTKAPWYPLSPPMLTEYLTAAVNGYPYGLKALVSFMANPVYGHAGLRGAVADKLKDPKVLPLFVAIDAFINETNCMADYIVPDSVMYEAWGWTSPWSGTVTRASTARWPVIEPRQVKAADGDRVTMEKFFIDVGLRLGLPGFGDAVIADADGTLHPLKRPEDCYLRAGANVAYAGTPVPDASDDDIALSGVGRIVPELEKALKPEEVRKVAFVFARGGRFQDHAEAYDGEAVMADNRVTAKAGFCIYNEAVATAVNTMTGKRHSGVPAWYPLTLADGTPLRDRFPEAEWPFLVASYKSNMQSSYSIGSPRLRQVHPNNPISVSVADAARLGIASGDAVRLVTPGGSVVATALVRHGIRPGAIAVEHGYGHTELGARRHVIDGVAQPDLGGFSAGVNLNDVGLMDPTREGVSTLGDWVIGSAARQALPARLEKVAAT
ncbi:molybdopterin dinucleotide binding domain-containing protein [Caenispirillum bisanense]|uniref:Tetrathionate reductase alpha subunit n=1 Tax=Caenispirillum bisanense TaxID=414052 RepID=A0A286G765_9PROT|nr:molybdopterin dinucleotide binding domain-containing protein [Caenispirillum bisanense]SOD90969.1 tetrathionate reductase alpha subunit precursor [Caenispirillum bisanense]